MLYRMLTVIGGLIFVAVLFALLWTLCKKFLESKGVTEQLSERTTALATWTFAGLSVGLVFMVVGAFILGPLAFYRTLKSQGLDVSSGAAIWWGFGIVLISLSVTAATFAGFLLTVGAY